MQKRLKEIVIYILENGRSLEPQEREQLEAVRDQLGELGLPADEFAAALKRVLDMALAESPKTAPPPLAAGAARDYLARLQGLGLIDEEQIQEILARAGAAGIGAEDLDAVQFLAASLIFDEKLGLAAPGEHGRVGAQSRLH
jgi:hypothetical protein